MSTRGAVDDHEFWAALLKAGSNADGSGWYYHNLYYHNDFLRQASKKMVRNVTELNPNFLCALRSSGLPLALLLSLETNKKCLWFVDPEADSLLPGRLKWEISQTKASIMMIDAHVVTGGTLIRHAIILESLGAKLCSPSVLLDCDSFEERRYRSEAVESWFEARLLRINSLVKLSKIQREESVLLESCPKLRPIFENIKGKGKKFWEFNRNEGSQGNKRYT